ncbi:hypothetical protein KEM55_001561 [Ascosphaera atra]|nr:hypothetical protein KEM55_001561 [Ascosphaera atra]
MAKGLRSHVKQKHKARLRNTVFAPVINARTERLSQRLRELAAQPRETVMEDAKTEEPGEKELHIASLHKHFAHGFLAEEKDESSKQGAYLPNASSAMELDEGATQEKPAASKRSSRLQKRHRRKTRPAINFKPHPGKLRKASKK